MYLQFCICKSEPTVFLLQVLVESILGFYLIIGHSNSPLARGCDDGTDEEGKEKIILKFKSTVQVFCAT